MLARTDSESDLGLWDIVLTSTLSSKPWMYSTLSTFALFAPPPADIAALFRSAPLLRLLLLLLTVQPPRALASWSSSSAAC